MMLDHLRLHKVDELPRKLEEGILYVSLPLSIAGHLCPCGCKNKVFTPLGDIGWSFKEQSGEGTLFPSLGNWQLPCKSHYWIRKGKVVSAPSWTEEEIEEGREADNEKVQKYFDDLYHKRSKVRKPKK